MEISIDINNDYVDWNVDEVLFYSCAKQIFEYLLSQKDIFENSCLKDYDYMKISFDFLLCDSNITHKINREYRNKDYPADIITFSVFADSKKEERFILDNEIYLGEIIIALDKIIESACLKNINKENELTFFISHGIMHLLGFDHQTEVDYNFVVGYQKKSLESINIKYDKI